MPSSIRGTATLPNIALQNAMVCRVFRYLKLGYIKQSPEYSRSSAAPRMTDSVRFATLSGRFTVRTSTNVAEHIDTSTMPAYSGEHPLNMNLRSVPRDKPDASSLLEDKERATTDIEDGERGI